MAFNFQQRTTTTRTVRAISEIIREIGEDMEFFGPIRRAGVKMNARFADGSFGFFAPNADDDPFSSVGPKPEWSIGWQWGTTVTNSMNMTLKQGWSVIFHVFDEGATRSVLAKVQGGAISRKEPTRFVELVFKQL